MFPDTPKIFPNDIFQLSCIARGEVADELLDRESKGGLIWEIPLESSLEKINKLGIGAIGPDKRSVTIMTLPNIGTQDDLNRCVLDISSLLRRVGFQEIVVDYSMNDNIYKYRSKAMDCLLKCMRKRKDLIKKILSTPELKQKYIELGCKIFERVKDRGSFYIYEEKNIGLPRLVRGKVEIEVLVNSNLNDFFEEMKSVNLGNDEQKVNFYFDLILELKKCYDHMSGVGSLNVNVKESCFELIKDTIPTLEKLYSKADVAAKLIVEKADELKINESIKSRIKSINGLMADMPRNNVDKEIIVDNILSDINIEMLLQQTSNLLEDIDNSVLRQLNLMQSIVSDEGEKEFLLELGTWKKAWKERDIHTLKKLKDLIPEMSYSSLEFQQIFNRIKGNIDQNKSSLFILPLKSVTDDENIIDNLAKNGIIPKQLIGRISKNEAGSKGIKGTIHTKMNGTNDLQVTFHRNIPEIDKVRAIFYRIISPEGKEVGHLLGTIHFANENMIRLNTRIMEAFEKSDSVYLEIKPECKFDINNLKPVLPKDLDSSQIGKINNFIDLIFPELLDRIKKAGMSKGKINLISESFPHWNFETKIDQVYAIITELTKLNAKIVHFDSDPIGIDFILTQYASLAGKEVSGLEENTLDRMNLLKQMAENERYSKVSINKLPSSKEGLERYLEKQFCNLTKMCDAWNAGDETYFQGSARKSKKNPELHKKIISNRDELMSNRMNEVLVNQIKGYKSFFAIGTLHIDGVISDLTKKSWSFEKI